MATLLNQSGGKFTTAKAIAMQALHKRSYGPVAKLEDTFQGARSPEADTTVDTTVDTTRWPECSDTTDGSGLGLCIITLHCVAAMRRLAAQGCQMQTFFAGQLV